MADIVYSGDDPLGVLGQGYLPENYDLVLYRGDFFPMTVVLKDDANVVINLTGYTAKAMIKDSYEASTGYDFTATITAAQGKIDLVLTSAVSATIPAGSYIWDFQITDPSGNVRTLVTGDVTVFDEVSK